MVEIPRRVSKIGTSWVLKLDKETREMLKVTEEGEVLIVKRKDFVENERILNYGPEPTVEQPE